MFQDESQDKEHIGMENCFGSKFRCETIHLLSFSLSDTNNEILLLTQFFNLH